MISKRMLDKKAHRWRSRLTAYGFLVGITLILSGGIGCATERARSPKAQEKPVVEKAGALSSKGGAKQVQPAVPLQQSQNQIQPSKEDTAFPELVVDPATGLCHTIKVAPK
ncbi:MAG: hypothetical protein ACYC1U_01185 [Candidatus Aquicultorales bacterium]